MPSKCSYKEHPIRPTINLTPGKPTQGSGIPSKDNCLPHSVAKKPLHGKHFLWPRSSKQLTFLSLIVSDLTHTETLNPLCFKVATAKCKSVSAFREKSWEACFGSGGRKQRLETGCLKEQKHGKEIEGRHPPHRQPWTPQAGH